jgi:hypothetical protein
MGISATRVHGALPRAVNVATVAVDRHRRTLQLTDRDAQVLFVRRDITALDLAAPPQRTRRRRLDHHDRANEQPWTEFSAPTPPTT